MNQAIRVAAHSTVPSIKLLINGKFIESTAKQWRDVVNPVTQEVLARVPLATEDEINAAVASAKAAFKNWRKISIASRARIFRKYRQLIRDNMTSLAAMLTAKQGKTLSDAKNDILRGLEVVDLAANMGSLPMNEIASTAVIGVDISTLQQPVGVCAGIVPFNFPALIPLWMFPLVIACGNTYVLKPSWQDPILTMRLVELALLAGIPPGVLNVVHGGELAVNMLRNHAGIQAVSSAGSTRIASHAYQQAALDGERMPRSPSATISCLASDGAQAVHAA